MARVVPPRSGPGAYVDRLETDARGHTVTGVHVRVGDELAKYHSDIVVVAAGALSSSLLMFRSANTAARRRSALFARTASGEPILRRRPQTIPGSNTSRLR